MTWLFWTLGTAFTAVLIACGIYTADTIRIVRRARRAQTLINRDGR